MGPHDSMSKTKPDEQSRAVFDNLFTTSAGEGREISELRAELLDALFDQMPIGMAVIDRDMKLLRVNPSWRASLQRYAPLSDLQGKTALFDLFPDDRQRFQPTLSQAFDGKIIRTEAVAMQRDGVVSYWDVVVTPLRHTDTINTLLIVVVDASDRVFANRLLEEKEAQYRSIFESTSDGVIIHDAQGIIVEANPAACAMYGYTYDEIIGKASSEPFMAALDEVLHGSSVDFQTVRYRKNGEPFNVEVRATLFTYRGEPHMLSVVRDITERVQAYQMLEQRVAERTRELSILLTASNNITATLELEPLLDKILDELKAVIDFSGAAVLTVADENILKVLVYCGPIPEGELQREWTFEDNVANASVITGKTPVLISDMSADTPMAAAFRKAGAGTGSLDYIRSWMGIPLIVRERVIGMLGFDSETPNYFNQHHANLALAFANHAAAAMDNARLYEEEQERRYETEQRRRVAEGLRDILTIINSNRSLEAILDYIVAQAGRLLGTDSIAIYEFQRDENVLTVQTSIGLDQQIMSRLRVPFGRGAVGRAVAERHPICIHDLMTLDLPDDEQYNSVIAMLSRRYKALLAVPLIARDEVYGGMVVYYPQKDDFSDEEIQLVVAVCDQAALAIDNARLRAQAAQAAVAAERSRLARDLHDAVTQTLFSASLIAEVLPRLWERDRDEGLRRLADLRQLTRGALAEMRTLLLELRPATLVEVELRDLLRQLSEALVGRARIPVNLHVEGQPRSLPPDAQIVFYRVAQEVLEQRV